MPFTRLFTLLVHTLKVIQIYNYPQTVEEIIVNPQTVEEIIVNPVM